MNKNAKNLIFVLYASTGSGHSVAAQAISQELKENLINDEIRCIDILDYFPKSNSGDKFVSATSGFLAPVFDVTWRKNFTGRVLWGGGNLWPSFLYKKFEEYLINEKPDIVVCTHQVCANVASKARLKMSKYFKLISVPTDYETEGLWPHMQTDLFCVANEEMKKTLLSRKVHEEKILISGIPVLMDFKKSYNKQIILEKFGIPKDKKIALVICGANESGPYKNIRKVLNESFEMLSKIDWMHFVFCVGNDLDYADKIFKKINKFNAHNMSVQNFTKSLPDLMKCADIAIIKPGGLVISECSCVGLPIILLGKTYAQENINRRYLLAMNAGVHASTYKGLINLLCDIFTNKNFYVELKNNIKKIANVNSARIISKRISDMLDNPDNYMIDNKNCIYIGHSPAHTR